MFIEAGLTTIRLGVPMHCTKRLAADYEAAGLGVGFDANSVCFYDFATIEQLEPFLGVAADFSAKNQLRPAATGAGLQVYQRLPGMLTSLFPGVRFMDQTDLIRLALDRCVTTRTGLHQIEPVDYFIHSKPDLTRLTSPQLSYPYILVDIRLNTRFIHVS